MGETTSKLWAAFVKAQAEIKGAPKDKDNPYFRSKYADLANIVEVIRGPFAKFGLAFLQDVTSDERGVTCVTTLIHESGERHGCEPWWVPIGPTVGKDGKEHPPTPQTYGSAATYARRQSLQAAAGVAAEVDDDGEAASAPTRAQPVKTNGQMATPPLDEGPASPEPPPPTEVEYQPSRERPEPVVFRFGNSKGQKSTTVQDKDLAFYIGCYKRDIADPQKARWLEGNERELQLLQAEVFWRQNGGSPTVEEEAF